MYHFGRFLRQADRPKCIIYIINHRFGSDSTQRSCSSPARGATISWKYSFVNSTWAMLLATTKRVNLHLWTVACGAWKYTLPPPLCKRTFSIAQVQWKLLKRARKLWKRSPRKPQTRIPPLVIRKNIFSKQAKLIQSTVESTRVHTAAPLLVMLWSLMWFCEREGWDWCWFASMLC